MKLVNVIFALKAFNIKLHPINQNKTCLAKSQSNDDSFGAPESGYQQRFNFSEMKILSEVYCLLDRKSNSESNLTDSLTVWSVNIISTETLKQMALFFHHTKTLFIHPIVSLQPNGLRIFKKGREERVHQSLFFSLRLTSHVQLLSPVKKILVSSYRIHLFCVFQQPTRLLHSSNHHAVAVMRYNTEKVNLAREKKKNI